MKKKIFIAAAVFFSSHSIAQDITDTTALDPVVFTANKIYQKQNETGKVLSVIGRADLEKSGTISDALNRVVGLHFGGANSTTGTVQSAYIRGASSANTLILLDGVPMYDPSGISSEFDLNSFSIDQVERIEILKGAQSTLYGSDAVAGVINIISRKPAGNGTRLAGNIAAGSYNTFRGGLSVSGASDKIGYVLGYSGLGTGGFSSAYDSTGTFENDRSAIHGLNVNFNFNLHQNLRVRLYGKYNTNRSDIDAGKFTDDRDYYYRTKDFTPGTAIVYTINKTALYFNYNYHSYERMYRDDSMHIGGYSTAPGAFYVKYIDEKYKGSSHFAELFANVKAAKKINIVSGIDYRTSNTDQRSFSVTSFGPFTTIPIGDTAKVSQYSVYSSLLYNGKVFNAGIGGRYNHHSVYGSNGTFSVNPSVLYNSWKLFINISSGYRVPSLYQLYSEFGNRALEPERSVSYEAGLQYNKNDIMSRVVFFRREIKDVFVFYTDYTTFLSKYINEDEQDDKGVELEARFTPGAWDFTANYTYVTGKLTTKDPAGRDSSINNLYRRPKNTLNFSAGYTVKNLFVRSSLRSLSALYEPIFMSAPVRLDGYYTLDLYAEYRLQHFKFFTELRNITDQTYFDQEGFTTKGFNVMVGVRFGFGLGRK